MRMISVLIFGEIFIIIRSEKKPAHVDAPARIIQNAPPRRFWRSNLVEARKISFVNLPLLSDYGNAVFLGVVVRTLRTRIRRAAT